MWLSDRRQYGAGRGATKSARNASQNWAMREFRCKIFGYTSPSFPAVLQAKTRVEKGLRRGIHVRTTCTQNDAESAQNGLPNEGGASAERAETARGMANGESLS